MGWHPAEVILLCFFAVVVGFVAGVALGAFS